MGRECVKSASWELQQGFEQEQSNTESVRSNAIPPHSNKRICRCSQCSESQTSFFGLGLFLSNRSSSIAAGHCANNWGQSGRKNGQIGDSRQTIHRASLFIFLAC